jgi:hypothetical protein
MTRARRTILLPLLAAAFLAAVLVSMCRRPEAAPGPTEPPAHVAAAEDFLQRHAANVLAADGAATADFVVEAVAADPARPRHIRTFVRRQPFGFRRELRDSPDGLPVVQVSDGRHAWRPGPDAPAGLGELLRGEDARLVLESAWIDSLRYLDASGLAQRLMLGPAMSLPVLPGTPRELVPTGPVQPMVAYLPSGLELRLYFDPADGRLLGLANPTIVPQRNVRYGELRSSARCACPRRASRTGAPVSPRAPPCAPCAARRCRRTCSLATRCPGRPA